MQSSQTTWAYSWWVGDLSSRRRTSQAVERSEVSEAHLGHVHRVLRAAGCRYGAESTTRASSDTCCDDIGALSVRVECRPSDRGLEAGEPVGVLDDRAGGDAIIDRLDATT